MEDVEYPALWPEYRCTNVKVDRLDGTQVNLRYTEVAYRNYVDPATGEPVPDGIYANTETWYPMKCSGEIQGYSYVVTGKVRVSDLLRAAADYIELHGRLPER